MQVQHRQEAGGESLTASPCAPQLATNKHANLLIYSGAKGRGKEVGETPEREPTARSNKKTRENSELAQQEKRGMIAPTSHLQPPEGW